MIWTLLGMHLMLVYPCTWHVFTCDLIMHDMDTIGNALDVDVSTYMTRVHLWLDNAWYGHVFAWSFLAKFVLLTEGHLSSMWQCNIRNIMTFLHMVCNETEGLKVSFSIHVDTYLSMIDIIELPCIHVWVSLLLPTSSTLWNENTKLHHQYKS